MKQHCVSRYLLLSALLTAGLYNGHAQLIISGQLRPRTEFRNGQGSPLPRNADPAIFVSQRTRLNLDYSTYRLKFGFALQDVRVWGQDVSTINRPTSANNNGLMLHEAWAQISLMDTTDKKHNLSFKAGRQEIILDDQRLLGNLDWLQQARHHDAGLFRYEAPGWNITAGGAYNQNKENSTGTVYIPVAPGNYAANTNGGSMYRSFEFAHASKKLKSGNISFLLFADQFNKFTLDSIKAKVWTKGSSTRVTTGLYYNNLVGRTLVNAAAYFQGGRNPENERLSAMLASVSLQYKFGSMLTAGPGFDFTSGGRKGSTSQAFDPLYGTPHKFWGLMDYFYAGSGFGNKGLQDFYIRSAWQFTSRLRLNADLHHFSSASAIRSIGDQHPGRSFGEELDLVLNYAVTDIIKCEAGFSYFLADKSLSAPDVKNVADARRHNQWAYLMITIRPTFFTAK